MIVGNKSKTALGAARAALLAGASAVALSLSIGAANAQNVQLNGVAGSDFVTIDPAGNLGGFFNGGLTTGTATGLSFNNGATATFNGPNFTTSINGDGLNTSGFVTVTAGAAFQQLNGTSLVTSDGAGTASVLSSTNLTVNTGTFGTTGNTTIDNGGNLNVGTAANPANLVVTGQTTTNGINNTGALNQDGVATFTNGANQGTSTISGGIVTIGGAGNIGGNISTLPGNAALTVSGGEIVNNGLIVHGGSELDGGATINGGAAINGGATIHGGATVFGGATVNNGFTANGGVHLNGGTTISNSLSVTPGSNIDMGGNVVHDVATPILGTDAANKAYVDKGVNKAYEGTALALAISQPIFLPGQTFAIRGGWGEYESRNAFGVSAAGVIAHNVFGNGSTVSLDGGVGVGTSYNGVAGKAGITIGFGGGAYPLK